MKDDEKDQARSGQPQPAVAALTNATITEMARKGRLDCHVCGKPAICVGRYEGSKEFRPACDECCGHGNEDGVCWVIADAVKEMSDIIVGFENVEDMAGTEPRPSSAALDRLAQANAHRPKLWKCPDCHVRCRIENAPNHADTCEALQRAVGEVYCRCGHLRDDHGSRYEQGKGEKRYVQPCEHCPCEVFTEKGGALDRMIESFQKVGSYENQAETLAKAIHVALAHGDQTLLGKVRSILADAVNDYHADQPLSEASAPTQSAAPKRRPSQENRT